MMSLPEPTLSMHGGCPALQGGRPGWLSGATSACMDSTSKPAAILCRVTVRRGAVLSAGAWTGQMLADMLGDPRWEALFRPRKGHLLCFQGPTGMPPLHHGMMEMGYTQVYTARESDNYVK